MTARKRRPPGFVSMEPHVPVVPEGAEVTVEEHYLCATGHQHRLDDGSPEPTEKMQDGTIRRRCPQLAAHPWTDIDLYRYAHPVKDETAASVHRSLETGDAGGLRRHGERQRGLLERLLGL